MVVPSEIEGIPAPFNPVQQERNSSKPLAISAARKTVFIRL
jgi:hypothetical protein